MYLKSTSRFNTNRIFASAGYAYYAALMMRREFNSLWHLNISAQGTHYV